MDQKTPPIVIDTNVYLSAAISPKGSMAAVLNLAEQTGASIIQTPQTIAELEQKLISSPAQKIIQLTDENHRNSVYERAKRHGSLMTAEPNFTASRDLKDNMFVDAAIAGRAEFIVSLDKDLLVLKNVQGIGHTIEIVTPTDYARHMRAREDLEARRSTLASAAEHHTSRAVGAVSLGVDLAQGNYGAAAVDAAAMAAENKAVQEAAVETAAKVGGSGIVKAFAACAKRAPVIGAAVTLAFVAKEAGAHVLDGEYKLAGAATVAGLAEAGGNVLGFGMGDAAREAARGAMIAAGGDEFAAVEKSGIRELSEAAYDVGKQMLTSPQPAQKPPEGRVLTDILPADIRSMTQGADEMGDRSEIRHVAVERTGLATNDPRNDLGAINQNPEGPKAHLLILADGRVQGPDEGGVPFDRNPSIAAGKNGETIGVMYAGQGAMNDAQWSTVRQISDYVEQQRRLEGRGGKPELMAGTTATADMLGLPTPRGGQLAQTTQTPAFHQRQAMGGFS